MKYKYKVGDIVRLIGYDDFKGGIVRITRVYKIGDTTKFAYKRLIEGDISYPMFHSDEDEGVFDWGSYYYINSKVTTMDKIMVEEL
jgi:hypothetical protein